MTDQEINEAVAVKLGFDIRNGGIYYEEVPDDVQAESHPIPDYCHSITAAWEVVEKMQEQFDYVEVIKAKKSNWSCGVRNSTIWETWESAPTAPMAICLAFLKLKSNPLLEGPSRERYGA